MTSILIKKTELMPETLISNWAMTRLIAPEGFLVWEGGGRFLVHWHRFCVCNWQLVGLYRRSLKVMTFWRLNNRQMKVFASVPERRRVEMQKVYFETSVFLVRTFSSYLPIHNATIYKTSNVGHRSVCLCIFTRKSLSQKWKASFEGF
jgi:hypothetical protein